MKRSKKCNGSGCAVPTCKNYSSVTGRSVTYHIFPKDTEAKQRWIKLCGRPSTFNTNGRYVCSAHFTKEDYLRDFQHELLNLPLRHILKNGANPSINLSIRCDNEFTDLDNQQSCSKKRKKNGEDNCIIKFECESLKQDDETLIDNITALKDENENPELRQNTIEDGNETFKNCMKITVGENEKFDAEMKKITIENENLRAEMKKITNENEKLQMNMKEICIENENLYTNLKKITIENVKLHANVRKIANEQNKLLNNVKEQKVAIEELQKKYSLLSFQQVNENMSTQSTTPATDYHGNAKENGFSRGIGLEDCEKYCSITSRRWKSEENLNICSSNYAVQN